MKKITNSAILALVLATTSIEAGSWYVGIEQSLMNNVDNTTEIGNYSFSNDKSLNITSFKIGSIADGDKGNHYEFLYNTGEKSANPIGGLSGSSLTSLSFNWNITTPTLLSNIDKVLPYFRLGANYAISDDQYYVYGTNDKEDYSALGLTLGVGGYYQLNDKINLSLGFDYGYRIWRTLTNGRYDMDSTDKIKKLYVGVDYLF